MRMLLGSTSTDKRRVLEAALIDLSVPATVVPVSVASGVPEQPLAIEIIRRGAEQRARAALAAVSAEDVYGAFGLEGGLVPLADGYGLVCVAVLLRPSEEVSLGESEPLAIPTAVATEVRAGEAFGVAIRRFAAALPSTIDESLRAQVSELVSREKSFRTAIFRAWEQNSGAVY